MAKSSKPKCTKLKLADWAFVAETLVLCPEGSPEGFDPLLFTTGTTVDALSVPSYRRLVAF